MIRKSGWTYKQSNRKNSGSSLVVEEYYVIQTSMAVICKVISLNLLTKVWFTCFWTQTLGSWACTVSCMWDFKFSCLPLFISITIHIVRFHYYYYYYYYYYSSTVQVKNLVVMGRDCSHPKLCITTHLIFSNWLW